MTTAELAGAGAEPAETAAAPADEPTDQVGAAPLSPVEAAQARLRDAEEKHAAASAVEEERAAAVRAVEQLVREAREALEQLEALDELTAEQVLDQENARRRLRRLVEEDLAGVRKAHEQAREEASEARAAVGEAHRQVLVEELDAMDADWLRDVQQSAARLRGKRARIFDQLHALWADRPGGDFKRGKISALAPPGDAPLVAACAAYEELAAIRRQQADQNRANETWKADHPD